MFLLVVRIPVMQFLRYIYYLQNASIDVSLSKNQNHFQMIRDQIHPRGYPGAQAACCMHETTHWQRRHVFGITMIRRCHANSSCVREPLNTIWKWAILGLSFQENFVKGGRSVEFVLGKYNIVIIIYIGWIGPAQKHGKWHKKWDEVLVQLWMKSVVVDDERSLDCLKARSLLFLVQ